jgi:hypothetical protein
VTRAGSARQALHAGPASCSPRSFGTARGGPLRIEIGRAPVSTIDDELVVVDDWCWNGDRGLSRAGRRPARRGEPRAMHGCAIGR